MNKYSIVFSRFLIFAGIIGFFASVDSSAQKRDYLTENEIEIIRDAQDIDERITVLTQMIDRRFLALSVNVNGWKDAAKVSDKWGEVPKGTRIQLHSDIKSLLQKAVDDIDNLAAHPDSAPIREKGDKKAKKDKDRFPTAVRSLADAAARYLGPLKKELENSKAEIEKGPILDSIDLCEQIIEAVSKLSEA